MTAVKLMKNQDAGMLHCFEDGISTGVSHIDSNLKIEGECELSYGIQGMDAITKAEELSETGVTARVRKQVEYMNQTNWMSREETVALRFKINEYAKSVIDKKIPQIPYSSYQQYIISGSRKESEQAYFTVRKHLTALGLYLQWNNSEEAVEYFNELLWSVSNEFSWCLPAHLPIGETGFFEKADQWIDLFAAETAATLSEILKLHSDKISLMLQAHLVKQIQERVIRPFLEHPWEWEHSKGNWCSVCSGAIGMAALLLPENSNKQQILDRVDKNLTYYISCYGDDGASKEGIGYWGYGFGYYIYYTAMRKELDPGYQQSEELQNKIRRIAEFPQLVQMSERTYIPFSDASECTVLPTGLLSYLVKEYGVKPPLVRSITPFDFEDCYRFAHISRNLWWTDQQIFHQEKVDQTIFLADAEWLIQKKDDYFFAVKGGNNQEEHNHNDVGSFVVALGGELILTDLGAGIYTADYFSTKRYEYPHTRSYWHNLPIIDNSEEQPTVNSCEIKEVITDEIHAGITMELTSLYLNPKLKSFQRRIDSNTKDHMISLIDTIDMEEALLIEEGFVSGIKPRKLKDGIILWKGQKGKILLYYDAILLKDVVEEKRTENHRKETVTYYRLGLRLKDKAATTTINLKFQYDSN